MAQSQQDAALIGNYFSHNSAQGHGTYLSNDFLHLTFLNSMCANRFFFTFCSKCRVIIAQTGFVNFLKEEGMCGWLCIHEY